MHVHNMFSLKVHVLYFFQMYGKRLYGRLIISVKRLGNFQSNILHSIILRIITVPSDRRSDKTCQDCIGDPVLLRKELMAIQTT